MANKRKRDDSSDSDPDEITPGRQSLPVANLPPDFDQEPQDGLQYLFLVRRDAHRLPHVTRAQNPYEVPETKVEPISTLLSPNVLPCEEWRTAFQTHFSNLRKNLTQATIQVDDDHSGSSRRVVPEKKDRDAWWKFLTGHPESAWSPRSRSGRKKSSTSYHIRAFPRLAEVSYPENAMIAIDVQPGNEFSHLSTAGPRDLPRNVTRQPDLLETIRTADSAPFTVAPLISFEGVDEECIAKLSPPEVTPNHLREIDHRMSIHLLMYFTHWINVHLQNPSDPMATISTSHGRWMFALLTKVEDRLSADEMNLLRNLARACLGLIQIYGGERVKGDAAVEEIPSAAATDNKMSNVSCWMVFTAVAGHWGQRDLWGDAETMLASV